jgi:CRISPR type I-E-associated protein CasB/Cse2
MEETMDETQTSHATLGSLIGRIATYIGDAMAAGDVASLRKLRPGALWSPAFWRILVVYLSQDLPAGGQARLDAERDWAVIVQAVAQLRGLHQPEMSLGRAMARVGASEPRLLRLLRASGEPLAGTVRTGAHQLAVAGQAVDCADLGRLVLSDGHSDEQPVRERIAYDYYSEIQRTEKEETR